MLAFSNDYYGMIFRATQSVELFCAYCTVVRPAGNLIIIRFENGGGIQVNKNRLFATKEAAEESISKAEPKPVVAQQRGYRSPYDYWH